MEIKTITVNLACAADFDEQVNAAIRDGYRLTKRERVQVGVAYGGNFSKDDISTDFVLYAELEKPDAAPDPVELVRELQACCDCVALETCQCGGCPLEWLCGQIGAGRQLDEWELPEEG